MFKGQKDREPNLVDPPASFKSPVWQYFGFAQITSDKGVQETDKTKSICKICKGSVSYSSGNTSNMSTHLKRKHPEITLQKPESKPKNPTAEQAKAKPQTASNLTTSTPGNLDSHRIPVYLQRMAQLCNMLPKICKKYSLKPHFLAHLSRRLIDELIVWPARLCVCQSVCLIKSITIRIVW